MELSVKEEVKKRMSEEYDKLSNSVAQLLSEKIKLNEQEHENFLQLQNLPIVRKLQSSVDFLRNETHKLHQQKMVLLNKILPFLGQGAVDIGKGA